MALISAAAAAAALVLLALALPAQGQVQSTLTALPRVNATGAINTFMISDCGACTVDKNSIFCTQADSNDDWVQNATMTITIAEKIKLTSAADGVKYCWAGTFGYLLQNSGNYTNLLGTTGFVACQLECAQQNLYYRQCVINAQLAAVLISIGVIVFVCCCTCGCFYCGCCKCCNNPNDDSNWGMCNRYCPSAPCADPPDLVEHLPDHLANPKSEEENLSSLFGKNKKLNEVKSTVQVGMGELRKPGTPRADDSNFSVANPARKAKRYDDD